MTWLGCPLRIINIWFGVVLLRLLETRRAQRSPRIGGLLSELTRRFIVLQKFVAEQEYEQASGSSVLVWALPSASQ